MSKGVNYSKLDDRFWVNDGDDILWFDYEDEANQFVYDREIADAVLEGIRAGLNAASNLVRNWKYSLDPEMMAEEIFDLDEITIAKENMC